MKCPNHSQNDATGYCSVCGDFGCTECLFQHEGQTLCARHYRPIAKKIEEERKQEGVRKRHQRQRLVVRYLNGRCEYGVSFALNLHEPGFHLYLVDSSGTPVDKTKFVQFRELKAVFLVKSFDGKFDKNLRYREWNPEGAELVVRFKDGEVIRGFSLQRYDPGALRFHLIPLDPATNNVSVLVEVTGVEGVYTPDEYQRTKAQEKVDEPVEAQTTLSQEETMGDFYSETRNYAAAFEQYKAAAAKNPKLRRLVKKLFFTQYNLGVHHIKRHEYDKALAYMETLLKTDPNNPRVLKKVSQLRHIISKTSGTPETADET